MIAAEMTDRLVKGVDFTCVAVTSQQECTARGGTAFYPNQTCAQTKGARPTRPDAKR